ncbi:MAG: hypothetical protein JW888_12010 [Pirellulales bacterium]|nr:hypothetical protein [Pirellulales bacterium]
MLPNVGAIQERSSVGFDSFIIYPISVGRRGGLQRRLSTNGRHVAMVAPYLEGVCFLGLSGQQKTLATDRPRPYNRGMPPQRVLFGFLALLAVARRLNLNKRLPMTPQRRLGELIEFSGRGVHLMALTRQHRWLGELSASDALPRCSCG